jgi:nucleoside-diphosphate-sugar epimerase
MVDKPLVLITGVAGAIGSALAEALQANYTVAGLDQPGKHADVPMFGVDLSSKQSVEDALAEVRERFGAHIASVIHLAALL